MAAATKQANFLLPEDLIEELRKNVSKREQSKFVAKALKNEIKRLKLRIALTNCYGAWSDRDHPELKEGSEAFVRGLRKSSRMIHYR